MVSARISCSVLFALCSACPLAAQLHYQPPAEPVNITLYYNINWELTTPENYSYKREAYFDLNEMVFDGVYKDLSTEGKLIAEGYYQHGVKSGMQTDYYEDQSIKTTIEFSGENFTIWQKVTPDKKFEVAKGTGKFSIPYFYFFDLKIKQGVLQGEFLNGRKTGIWVYSDAGKKKTDVEYYDDGKLQRHVRYGQRDSVSVNYAKEALLSIPSIKTQGLAFDRQVFTSVNQYFEKYVPYPEGFKREVSFPGGIKNLLKIMANELTVPEGYLFIAKVKIDERGQLLKLSVARPVFDFTDEAGLKLIKSYESFFLPAIINGRPVVSVIYLPVASGEEWLELLRTMPANYFTNISNFD